KMAFSVRSFLLIPTDQRDDDWLRQSLQAAVELEFFTIPPYLTAMWSIETPKGRVYENIRRIVFQEMAHMDMVGNLLAAIRAPPPQIYDPHVVPRYPRPLPGEVRPDLLVGLERLSKALVRDVFMEIEHPECAPVARRAHAMQSYDSIGEFYDAILEALV